MSLFDFGKQQPAQSRYAGKPFLMLVDAFVMKAIGELDPSQEALLQKMTPKLRQTFNHTGTWEEIVIDQLGFTPDVGVSIQALWAKNQAIAKERGLSLTPQQFTEMFVKSNVADI